MSFSDSGVIHELQVDQSASWRIRELSRNRYLRAYVNREMLRLREPNCPETNTLTSISECLKELLCGLSIADTSGDLDDADLW